MKKKILFAIPVLLGMLVTGCTDDGGNDTTPDGSSTTPDSSSVTPADQTLEEFTGVTFSNKTVTYDGNSHRLDPVVGAPEGTTITYQNLNDFINAGSYTATASLSKEGYKNLSLTATLNITKATMPDFTYQSKVVTYDGTEHINDIQLVGVTPAGTTVVETVKNSSNETVTSAIEVGVYTYTCVLTNSNYETATLNATLQIKAQKKDMPVFAASDGTIYFANGLHDSFLYSLKNSNLKLLDYSSPKEFNKYNDNSALFIASSPVQTSVKEVTDESSNVLYTDSNIDDFVKYSDTVFYYSSNSLQASKSGIVKVDVTDTNNEPACGRYFTGKTDNLAIYGNYLYFTNGNNNNYVYKMHLTSFETSLVMQEKVHEFVIDDGKLYCTVNGTLNDYIGVLDLSTSATVPTKLTNAAGEFLKVKDGYLYYNNSDLFSVLDPSVKGIWRISTSGGTAQHLLEIDDVNGFDVESSNTIVYNDTQDLHLYRYNFSTQARTDLLDGFVAPESVPLNLGGRTQTVGTKTYYLNMYAGKSLYVYDETTKRSSQLTVNKVVDFLIYGDTLIFNQVASFTNNDLYSVSLTSGGKAERISICDVREMTCDGTYIYGSLYSFLGYADGLLRMPITGGTYNRFSKVKGAKDLLIRDGKIFYINCGTVQDNGYIEYIELSKISGSMQELEGTKLSNNIKNVKQYIVEGDNIYYTYNGLVNNSVRRTSFTSLTEGVELASANTNPTEIILSGDYIYYYSYPSSATSYAGFYRVNKNADDESTKELILGYSSTYYATSISLSSSGYLYFMNYIPKLLLGDAHFYQLNLSNKVITKIN